MIRFSGQARSSAALSVLLFALVSGAAGQDRALRPEAVFAPEAGAPFVRAFTPDDFEGSESSWAFTQDSLGVLYVGNDAGLMIYNGAHWWHMAMPNGSVVRSLGIGPGGHVVVGAQGEFGYVEPDSIGSLHYVSLVERLPEAHRSFNDIWRIAASPERAYFGTPHKIFWWDGTNVGVLDRPEKFGLPYQIGEEVYVADFDDGILRVEEDTTLVPVPGGERFIRGTTPAFALMRFDAEHLLVGTRLDGLYLLGPGGAHPWPTAADSLLRAGAVYHGTAVGDDLFAFGLTQGGVIYLNRRGEVVQHVQEAEGLPDENVLYTFYDDEGGLWAAIRGGLARIEYPSPLLRYGEPHGLTAQLGSIIRYQDHLYVGSWNGLYRLDGRPDGPGRARLTRHPEIGVSQSPGIQDMAIVGDTLLIAERNPIVFGRSGWRMLPGTAEDPDRSTLPDRLVRSRHDTTRFYVETESGLFTLTHTEAGAWIYDSRLVHFDDEQLRTEINSVAELGPGALLVQTRNRGLFRLDLGTDTTLTEIEAPFDTKQTYGYRLFDLDGTIYAGLDPREDGGPTLFRFDPSTQSFVSSDLLGSDFIEGRRGLFLWTPDADGNLWLRTPALNGPGYAVAWRTPEGYRVDSDLLRRLPDEVAHAILPEGDSLVWFATNDGLFRYDRRIARPAVQRPLRTVIDAVFLLNDSTAYGGHFKEEVKMHPHQRSVRFQFGLPRFEDGAAAYQFRLDGLDDDWSAWTDEDEKDYSGLPPGRYRFHVRGRDVYGRVSEAATFSFRILPPWYQTWWAYLVYGLLLGSVLVAATRYAAQLKLKRQIRRLETERRLHEERERISRDLHDHVGAQLSNIISAVELVHLSARHGDADRMIHYLDGLDGDARTTMARLRETIWAIHQESITAEAFGKKVHAFAEERTRYQEKLTVAFHFEAAPGLEATTLRPMQALHLFRIAQEAISNAVKHAGARHLYVTLHLDPSGQLALEVRDDGSFKAPDGPGSPEGGFGMTTMQERAQQIDGRLDVDASASGTAVRVTVPVAAVPATP